MKRLSMHWGHSVRSVFLRTVVTSCVGFILVLGVAQALTAENQPDTSGPVSPQLLLSAAVGPGVSGKAGHRGELGRICIKGYCPQPPLIYRGGKGVQHKPWLFVIFWGSNWNTKGSVLSRQMIKMYKNFSGSSYQGILTQYFDGNGHIEKTIKVVQPYTDTRVAAPSELTKVGLETEVSEAITTNGWPKAFDGQYIVVTAPGTKYHEMFSGENNNCGFHNKTGAAELSYSFLPYYGEEPYLVCVSGGNVNGSDMGVASHEYAESATDPFLETGEAAWNTKNEAHEITDICASGIDQLADGSWVKGQWDNYQRGCSLSDDAPAWVYVITEPAEAVTSTTATLKGVVNPEGMATKYHWEYGTTTAYGTSAPIPDASAGSGLSNIAVSQAITGLSPNTVYHFALVGSNSKGTAKGLDEVFTTRAAGFLGGSGNVKVFPEKTVLQTAPEGPALECKNASGEPAGTWAAQAAAENAEGAQEAAKNGPHLLLNIKLGDLHWAHRPAGQSQMRIASCILLGRRQQRERHRWRQSTRVRI